MSLSLVFARPAIPADYARWLCLMDATTAHSATENYPTVIKIYSHALSHTQKQLFKVIHLDGFCPTPCAMPRGLNLAASGNLTARKFDSIQRIKLLEFSAQAPWEKIFQLRAQYLCQNKKLQIRNAALLVFQASDRFPAGIPTRQLQFHRQLILRPTPQPSQLAHLRADHIQMSNQFFDGRRLATATI